MAKALRTIGTIAGIVALSFAIPGVGTAVGVSAATAATVSAAASAISAVAMAGAAALQRPPPAQGSVSQVLIGNNMAVPYAFGRTYVGGIQAYDNSGGEKNRIRYNINVLTAAGPIEAFETFLADYAPVGLTADPFGEYEATGFYANFLWLERKLGARPDPAAYDDKNPMPQWNGTRKMSGYASYKVAMKFDKDAKRFTGGVPQFGMVARYVKVYDPRKDSSYPGGSGPQRWDDEATWEYGAPGNGTLAQGENAALVALSYARGRYIERDGAGAVLPKPVKILGIGLRDVPHAVRMADWVELANLCDVNAWKAGGILYEGPGTSKWANLKRLLEVAATEPVWTGGELRLRISAPRPSLAVVNYADLADEGVEIRAMKPFKDRLNTLVPRYRSEGHRWEYVQADAVENPTYVAEDGESRTEERQFDFCQDKDQAARLAGYALVNARQFGPITLTLKPRFLSYRPGECLTLNLADHGLSMRLALITSRSLDPATGKVTLTLESAPSAAEHAWALTRTGTAPPTPTIRQPGEVDAVETELQDGTLAVTQLIRDSSAASLTFSVSAPSAGISTVTLSDHMRNYLDKAVAVTGATLTVGAAAGDLVLIYYDDEARAGGAVSYQALVVAGGVGPTELASTSPQHPFRHFVASKIVPASGATSGGTDAGSGGGGGGWRTVNDLQ